MALAALPLLLIPGNALALGVTINPGVIMSGVISSPSAFALGGEASFMLWPKGNGGSVLQQVGFGAFFQAQAYNFDHGRYALGVQAGNVFGGELGWTYRERSATGGSQHGAHVAVFGSLGVIVASIRATIPLVGGADATHPAPGFELAFCLSLKVPIPIGDVSIIKDAFGSGRLLRDGTRAIASSVAGLRDRPMARAWANDAQTEHASTPSFLRLASELEALGAPACLVTRARRAALEELRHADDCFAIASAHAGGEVRPVGWPTAATREASLERVAVEAWLDGCIGEGAAARLAHEASASDPFTRQALRRMARDEATHAELSWDVLAFALSTGGRPVARAVSRSRLEDAGTPDRDLACLDEHGRVPHARSIATRDHVAFAARERLAPMVRAHA